MHIWMALDPETFRISVQDREFVDGDLPAGLRGLRWPKRETDVDDAEYNRLLQGTPVMPGAEMDEVHVRWWDEARSDGEPLWPATA